MVESSQTNETGTFLTYGMVGGGEGAFIGDVHRKAINFDGKTRIVCGCFSTDPENTLRTGLGLGIPNQRLYESYEEMAVEEGKKADKIDFVVIVTPNFTHYSIARIFLENNINVVCDKPLTVTSAEAGELKALASEKGLSLCVTYLLMQNILKTG